MEADDRKGHCEGNIDMDSLSDEQIEEIEKDMENRIHYSCVMGDIIEFFVLILILLAIFFPDVLTNICHTISIVTGRIL